MKSSEVNRHAAKLSQEAQEAIRLTFSYSSEFGKGMRQILGEKAYHSADFAGNPAKAKQLLLKSTTKLTQRISEIITTDLRLREMLLNNFDTLENQIKTMDKQASRMNIVGTLFEIISRLLGYDFSSGNIYRTPVYFQTKSQIFAGYMRQIKNYDEFQKEATLAVLELRKICLQLKNNNYSYRQIALILNISEYEVRQLADNNKFKEASEFLNKLLETGLSLDDAMYKLTMEMPFELPSALIDRRENLIDRLRD